MKQYSNVKKDNGTIDQLNNGTMEQQNNRTMGQWNCNNSTM